MSTCHQGTVISVQANFYWVQLQNGSSLLCTRRTLLKKIGQKVMVGDEVLVEEPENSGDRGVISDVLPRSTELTRPAIANAQQLLLLFAMEEPPLEAWQLSRFLVKAESTSLDICVCLNKIDLVDISTQQLWQKRLQGWGYQPLMISVVQNIGLHQLKERLHQKTTILAGLSGAGKSSLVNYLIPNSYLRVGEVSGKLQQGRHTTRHVELFELSSQGFIADSPGFHQPELDFDAISLASYFPEIRERLRTGNCQFHDCLHQEEPNCIVRGDWERYEHYLKFLQEVVIHQTIPPHAKDKDERMKVKVRESGQEEYEPRLSTKKHRHTSRRKKHQHLGQEFLEDL